MHEFPALALLCQCSTYDILWLMFVNTTSDVYLIHWPKFETKKYFKFSPMHGLKKHCILLTTNVKHLYCIF
jgi:hypothetical protein